MKAFAELIAQLDATSKTSEKVRCLVHYFDKASDGDKLWSLALLSGKRPKRTVQASFLRKAAALEANLPLWIIEESYFVVGDLAETIALILPPGNPANAYTLSQCMEDLLGLKDASEDAIARYLSAMWANLGQMERFVFNKLITGGFRVGVSQKLMTKALALHLGVDEPAIAHRLMGNWTPQTTTFEDLVLRPKSDENQAQPYPFYLAYALEVNPAELGPISDWQLEYKWDGIRGQLIRRRGASYLWSRGEELLNDQFPDLVKYGDSLRDGCVIDGEIVVVEGEMPQTFAALQRRLGRKSPGPSILRQFPAAMIAYDLLEYEGVDIRDRPLCDRRALLSELLLHTEGIWLSDSLEPESWNEAEILRLNSRTKRAEGLMLKNRNSSYQTGRKRGDWWKWKVDPMRVDAVLIYAMRGHGRRANLYTDYTLAVWDADQLIPFTKAYSGLTDAELKEVDRFIKKNTLERFGPVRSVKPELVFEIGFEGIAKSPRHKSGIALRFPRILRWRKDKPTQEANTIQDLEQLLKQYGP